MSRKFLSGLTAAAVLAMSLALTLSSPAIAVIPNSPSDVNTDP